MFFRGLDPGGAGGALDGDFTTTAGFRGGLGLAGGVGLGELLPLDTGWLETGIGDPVSACEVLLLVEDEVGLVAFGESDTLPTPLFSGSLRSLSTFGVSCATGSFWVVACSVGTDVDDTPTLLTAVDERVLCSRGGGRGFATGFGEASPLLSPAPSVPSKMGPLI